MNKDINVEKKASSLSKFVNVLMDVVDIIWKQERYVNLKDKFFYTILFKITSILNSIEIQVYNLDNKPNYTIVTALALRTCMLDVLNLYYVMDEIESPVVMDNRVNTIMSDHLKHIYSDLSLEQRKIIQLEWKELFEKDGTLKKYTRLNSNALLDGINKFASIKTEAEEAKDLYDFFSKYEHNGAFTFNLIHNFYYSNSTHIIKEKIVRAIIICSIALRTTSTHWIEKENKLIAKLDLYIQELVT